MNLSDLPLRADLRGRTPYGAPQLEVAHQLNVNENPYPPSGRVVAEIAAATAAVAAGLNRYPDRDATELRADLARYVRSDCPRGPQLSGANIWPANGSNEVMLQLQQAFGGQGRRALGFTPTYSMYPDYCRDTFTEYVTAPRADDFNLTSEILAEALAAHAPDMVLLASPNNPTGTALDLDLVEQVLAGTRGMVIVDEAYAEFRRPGTRSAVELLPGNPRLVVTRTMSKAFALAGGRLGYLIADPAVVDAVQLVRLPYHLSAISQAVARVALANSAELLGRVADLRAERDALAEWLGAAGYAVAESDANFILFGRFRDRDRVWADLLAQGVLIRVTGPQGWLRVSIGTPVEMAAFRAALDRVVAAGDREA